MKALELDEWISLRFMEKKEPNTLIVKFVYYVWLILAIVLFWVFPNLNDS